MPDITQYLADLTAALQAAFGARLYYVGLRGSYSRGEAREGSDIDVMVVLDTLALADLDRYRVILASLGGDAPTCGFISGRDELAAWNRCEVAQLLHETVDYYGALAPLLPAADAADLREHIRIGVGNLYHYLCHSYLHRPVEKREQAVKNGCRQAFYLLQNLHLLRTGVWLRSHAALLAVSDGEEAAILRDAMTVRGGGEIDSGAAYARLFGWCRRLLVSLHTK